MNDTPLCGGNAGSFYLIEKSVPQRYNEPLNVPQACRGVFIIVILLFTACNKPSNPATPERPLLILIGSNYALYSDEEIDRISENHLRVLNPRDRLQMLQKAIRIVAQEIPYLPLLIYSDVYVVSQRINWSPPVNGEIRVKDIAFQIR